MNGFEQPKFEPPPQPETAQQKWEREQWEAEKMGQEIQERRAQREAADKPQGQFEQPPEEAKRVAFETKEGERFFAERLTSPEDPRVEKAHEMLVNQFSKEEVDPLNVMKEAMTGRMATGEECAPYLVHVAEDPEHKILGVHTGAVVETVNSRGTVSKESGFLLGCYTLVAPEARGKGIWKELFKAQAEAANKDAESRGLKVKGFVTEAHDNMEPVLNGQEVKRVYIKMKDGSFRELPYEQPPLDWDPKTGKPTEGAGIVPEHLMLKLSSGKNQLSGKELMEMVRGMYNYNNYREEEYFDNPKAYEQHTAFVEGIERKLADFVGKGKVYLLSAKEREAMINQGIKVETSEEAMAASERFKYGSRATGRIQQIEQEMAEEGAKSVAPAEKPAIPSEPEVKTPAETDEESKEAQWRAAAVHEGETSMEKMRKLFTRHGETGGAEAKTAETAEQTREATREEIARHLVERPGEALDIFKKGVGLKLERAAIGFASFWKRAGAEALKGLALPAEKTVGLYPVAVGRGISAVEEFFEAWPGIKRLNKVMEMHAQLERLQKEAATPEQLAQLKKLLDSNKYAARDEWEEIKDFNRWHEEKKRILDNFRTFGHARDKLSRWAEKQQAMAVGKKELAKQRRIRKTAEKL